MSSLKPLPATAQPDEPAFAAEFIKLAYELIHFRARSAIVTRYTGLAKNRVTQYYVALTNEKPAPGALMQGEPRFFAIPSKHTSNAWVLQSAIFLECYQRFLAITDYPIHPGWLLVQAYKAYLTQTQKVADDVPGTRRLDINQAYALLVRVGYLDPKLSKTSVLQRQSCPQCGVRHLIVTTEEIDAQGCPVCRIESNASRLVEQSTVGGFVRAGTTRSAARQACA